MFWVICFYFDLCHMFCAHNNLYIILFGLKLKEKGLMKGQFNEVGFETHTHVLKTFATLVLKFNHPKATWSNYFITNFLINISQLNIFLMHTRQLNFI